jgi:inorganic pyrophosphatase
MANYFELFDLYTKIGIIKDKTNNVLYMEDIERKKVISPWHDIPYKNKDDTVNMICEIPRYTRKKFEIDTKNEYNPIIQDTIDGEPREFKYGHMLFNYGAIPQTWEDPKILCQKTFNYGDNDPLDIIDIGDTQAKVGLVYKVKVIGIIALIDQGETDWKVIAINTKDINSRYINTLKDVEMYKPGCLHVVKEWFENYKTSRGKAKNKFALDGNYMDMEYTEMIIEKCHLMWQKIENRKHANDVKNIVVNEPDLSIDKNDNVK